MKKTILSLVGVFTVLASASVFNAYKFKGSQEDVVEYIKKLNKETSLGHYDYCLAEMLNW